MLDQYQNNIPIISVKTLNNFVMMPEPNKQNNEILIHKFVTEDINII